MPQFFQLKIIILRVAIPYHLRAVGDIAAPETHIAVTEAWLTGVMSEATKGRRNAGRRKKDQNRLTPPAIRIHR